MPAVGSYLISFFLWRLNVVSVVHLSENETSIMIRKSNEDNLIEFFYFLDTIAAFNQSLCFKYLYFIAKNTSQPG